MSYSEPIHKLAAVVSRSRHSKDFMIVQPYSVSIEIRILVRPARWWHLIDRMADARLLSALKDCVPKHVPVSLGSLAEGAGYRILYVVAGDQ